MLLNIYIYFVIFKTIIFGSYKLLLFLPIIYKPHVQIRAPALLTRLSNDKCRQQSRRKLLPVDNTPLSAQWSPGLFLGLWCKSSFCSCKAFSLRCMRMLNLFMNMLFLALFFWCDNARVSRAPLNSRQNRITYVMIMYQVRFVLISLLIILFTYWQKLAYCTLARYGWFP